MSDWQIFRQITDHVTARLEAEIAPGATDVTVYGYEPDRDKPLTVHPHVAVQMPSRLIDTSRIRPHLLVFEAFGEGDPVEVPFDVGTGLTARATGSTPGPFQIGEGVNDMLRLRTGIAGAWDPDVEVELIPAADRSADAIAWELNQRSSRLTAGDTAERLFIQTDPGLDLEILDGSRSAWPTLGIDPGVVSHLTRAVPAGFTVRPAPTPYKMLLQLDVRAHKSAQRDKLVGIICDGLFPVGSAIEVDDQIIEFGLPETFAQDDETAKPRYQTSISWWLKPIWVDRLTSYETPPIRNITTELTAEEA